MSQMIKKQGKKAKGNKKGLGAFPEVSSLLLPAKEKKHRSPTKRLIDFKNSTWSNKQRISE